MVLSSRRQQPLLAPFSSLGRGAPETAAFASGSQGLVWVDSITSPPSSNSQPDFQIESEGTRSFLFRFPSEVRENPILICQIPSVLQFLRRSGVFCPKFVHKSFLDLNRGES